MALAIHLTLVKITQMHCAGLSVSPELFISLDILRGRNARPCRLQALGGAGMRLLGKEEGRQQELLVVAVEISGLLNCF